MGEESVAFMLNWRENDYLTLQVPPSLLSNNPYIKVMLVPTQLSGKRFPPDQTVPPLPLQLGQLLASTCKELPGPKESRRTAKELWDVVVLICSVSVQHKRSSDGRLGLIKQRDSSLGILHR